MPCRCTCYTAHSENSTLRGFVTNRKTGFDSKFSFIQQSNMLSHDQRCTMMILSWCVIILPQGNTCINEDRPCASIRKDDVWGIWDTHLKLKYTPPWKSCFAFVGSVFLCQFHCILWRGKSIGICISLSTTWTKKTGKTKTKRIDKNVSAVTSPTLSRANSNV